MILPFLPPIVSALTLMVGHPVAVTCTTNGYEGTVVSNVAVQISPFMCHQYKAPYDDPYGRAASASGLLVVVHEGEHIRFPGNDEQQTECQALRDFVTVLGQIGVPRRYWFSMYQSAVSADRFYFGPREASCA